MQVNEINDAYNSMKRRIHFLSVYGMALKEAQENMNEKKARLKKDIMVLRKISDDYFTNLDLYMSVLRIQAED